MRTTVLAGTLLAGLALSPASWGAPNACGDNYVSAQRLRSDGRLLAARGALLACMRACSGTFREECSEWLTEVSARVPSIVVRAQDSDGNDVIDASVVVDGERVASALEGKPVEVEVGKHKIVLARPDGQTIEREIVASDGEVRRALLMRFEAPPSAAPRVSGNVEPAKTPGVSSWYFFVGGGALVAAGSVFGILAAAATNDTTCAEPCFKTAASGSDAPNPDLTHAEDAYHRANTFAWVSNIAIGAGLVAIGIGVYYAIAGKPALPSRTSVQGVRGTF